MRKLLSKSILVLGLLCVFWSCSTELRIKNNSSSAVDASLLYTGGTAKIQSGETFVFKVDISEFLKSEVSTKLTLGGTFLGPVANYIYTDVNSSGADKFTESGGRAVILQSGKTTELTVANEGGYLIVSNQTTDKLIFDMSLTADNFQNNKRNRFSLNANTRMSNTFLEGRYNISAAGYGITGTNLYLNNLDIASGKRYVITISSNQALSSSP